MHTLTCHSTFCSRKQNTPFKDSFAGRGVLSRRGFFLSLTATACPQLNNSDNKLLSTQYEITSCLRRWDSRAHAEKIGLGREVPLLLPWQQHLGSSSWDCLLSQSDAGPLDNLWHPARWVSLCGFGREQTPTCAWRKFLSEAAFTFLYFHVL